MADRSPVLIAGPTASGKTALAIALARALDGEIINADSMQLYDGLSVITARPSKAELAAAPHHLFGEIDPSRRYSVGDWLGDAQRLIDEIAARGRTPILAGGTGLYFTALTIGLADIPEIGEAARAHAEKLEAEGVDQLRAEAERLDPDAAAQIMGGDRQRLRRVVEVFEETGRPLSQWREATRPALDRWRGLVIEPERDALYARIEARFDAMMAGGALEEAGGFAARGLDPDLPAMKALGLPPLLAHLRGEAGLEEAIETAKRDSRRYAKRQLTWMRNQFPVWGRVRSLDPDEAAAEARAQL